MKGNVCFLDLLPCQSQKEELVIIIIAIVQRDPYTHGTQICDLFL